MKQAKTRQLHRVGAIRPSALIHTFGVGAAVELPRVSVVVLGLDEWRPENARTLDEPRLIAALNRDGFASVERLLAAPVATTSGAVSATALDAARTIGVPVGVFPRWLVCPLCRRLGPIESRQFKLRADPFRPDRTTYVHENCQKAKGHAPSVVPARFVVACENGHMDDFPWVAFVHRARSESDVSCAWKLRLTERGPTGEAADVYVRCETCDAVQPMSRAFDDDDGSDVFRLRCTGAHPHLRRRGECKVTARAILLGASNSWFSVTRSALSLPEDEDELQHTVATRWATFQEIESVSDLRMLRRIKNTSLMGIDHHSDAEIMDAIAAHRDAAVKSEPVDLRVREWQLLTGDAPPTSPDFYARPASVPTAYRHLVERVVLVERLREVQALTAFTRVLPPTGDDDDRERWVRLGRADPTWLPAAEVHGEGIFIQLRDEQVVAWRDASRDREEQLLLAHLAWCHRRGIQNPRETFPGMRTVLIHSFAHALMRRMALESGYSQSSIRERLYVAGEHTEGGPMAGLLLYTAAPGAEGTLGGLVSLGEPQRLGPLIEGALRDAAVCDSDPLCAETLSNDGGLTLHGAACYACMFAPETSCERGNRYLDRGVLVPLINGTDFGFFNG